MGLPPASDVKKCIPIVRSNVSKNKVAVKIGNAKITMTMLVNALHVNNGIFIKVIPGQRIFKIVTKKLIPDNKLPTPAIWTLQIQ